MAPKPKTPPPKSPFLAPRRSSSYGGTPKSSPHTSSILSIDNDNNNQHNENKEVEPEHKSNLIGCTANLITAIVGAGIIGIPFAMRETGLVAGWLLIVMSGVLGGKSLSLLVETAKHVDAASYEILAETVFGKPGWLICNALMFMMSWGPMLSYLMLVKETLPKLIGCDPNKCLIIASLCVMLPISLQRDMADLAKTSRLSVLFNIGLVGIVAKFSPTDESIEEAGGFGTILSQSIVRPGTCFIGLGIISFAFSCQHSSLIIAGSLRNPTRERWRSASWAAMAFCSILSIIMGTYGYLGFLEATEGNVLANFPLPFESITAKELFSARAANIGRGFLCGTMFFVYPLESFVARHVVMTNLFQGREAHEGDDHAVLDRWDRRVATTIALYLSALIPALNYDDIGIVLAWTGTIAATALTYIFPGILFIGVHGQEFLDLVESAWGPLDYGYENNPGLLNRLLWYALLMPLWCKIASLGSKGLLYYYSKKLMMTPGPQYRLGKVKHKNLDMLIEQKQRRSQDNTLDNSENMTLPANPVKRETSNELGLITTTNSKDYGSIVSNENNTSNVVVDTGPVEEDPQDEKQTVADFSVAIGFVLFGIVALTAGVISIYTR